MLYQKHYSFLTPFIACLFMCVSHIAVADEFGIVSLQSPDKTTIQDLDILSFRGVPISRIDNKLLSAEQKNLWRAGNIYTDLMRIKFATTKPNATRLKENFMASQITVNHQLDELGDNAWYYLLSKLASSTLTDQAFTQYGCKKEPCDYFELGRKGSPNMISWGGSQADQFKSRRAFGLFIDTELDKYLNWAEDLDPHPEVYFVGKTHLSPYIFDKGGFAIKLFYAHTVLPTSGNIMAHPIFKNEAFVKVNEAEAEKMIERVQRKPLYFVYKTKLTIADKSYHPETKQLHQLTFDQEFTSDVIEIFIGPELEDKLFDIPL